MEPTQLNWIANFIWGIADDVLRDLYVRGKYRDVILPMMVLRRIDSVLESSKQAVLDMKASLDKAGIVHQDQALRQAAGQAFSPFTFYRRRNPDLLPALCNGKIFLCQSRDRGVPGTL
jgi:type I restriction enzyme M protein